jgi:2-iminobutanoate/2-iminopropanoate deaminase
MKAILEIKPCREKIISRHFQFRNEDTMPIIKHNPSELFPPYRAYAHAIEIQGNSSLLIISGLNGYLQDGTTMPESFQEQGEIIWTHIGTLLRSAGMDYQNIVSLRTYLADPKDDEANVQLRQKYLGDHRTASTVICCQLLDSKWKLEIEAMAAK